ncbi:hypothetical protein CK203_117739 [Vitis vinifera]|uniref:Uncharacterized protein n=1 Tax=Vitis vinifera TaxID=29760 RepID=A0A438BSK5_VITVI|nr:hypothetical protein CK203_117739 [Vitis vinifera]
MPWCHDTCNDPFHGGKGCAKTHGACPIWISTLMPWQGGGAVLSGLAAPPAQARCSACRPWRAGRPCHPRHGAPAYATLKPRHANAKRARPRHRGEPSHATAVTPCPVHAAPRTRPMPPCGHALPPCNECPPRALGPVPPSRLDPSSEHVASEKRANGQTSRLAPGGSPMLPPDAAHQKAHGRPSPHATSALPVHSAPSRLAEEPRALERACCLGKLAMASVAARPGGLTHASRPTLPIKRHTDAPPPCNECPPRALGPVSARRGALEPRASMLPRKSLPVASVAAHPGGSPMPPPDVAHRKAHGCPSPHATSALPGARPPSRLVEEPSSLERACCLGKNVPVANVAAHPGGSPMPPLDVAHRKAHGCPSPPCNECPPGHSAPSRLVEEPSSLERACCLRKEPDASSPCLYRSYEGFTRCSRVLVRSRLRTSRGSLLVQRTVAAPPLHSKPQALQQALGVAMRGSCVAFLTDGIVPRTLLSGFRLAQAPAHAVAGGSSKAVAASHGRPTHAHTHERGRAWPATAARALGCGTLKRAWVSRDPVLARAKRSSLERVRRPSPSLPSRPAPSGASVRRMRCRRRTGMLLVDPAVVIMLVSKIKPCMFKKLVVGPWMGRPVASRCAPVASSLLPAMRSGLNWPGRASGAVTLKKLECSKQA